MVRDATAHLINNTKTLSDNDLLIQRMKASISKVSLQMTEIVAANGGDLGHKQNFVTTASKLFLDELHKYDKDELLFIVCINNALSLYERLR